MSDHALERCWDVARIVAAIDKQLLSSAAVEAFAVVVRQFAAGLQRRLDVLTQRVEELEQERSAAIDALMTAGFPWGEESSLAIGIQATSAGWHAAEDRERQANQRITDLKRQLTAEREARAKAEADLSQAIQHAQKQNAQVAAIEKALAAAWKIPGCEGLDLADLANWLMVEWACHRRDATESEHRLEVARKIQFHYMERAEKLARELAREEAAHEHTISQRDHHQEAADKLAYALFDVEEIGEHSNLNDPWENAAELLAEVGPKLATLDELTARVTAAEKGERERAEAAKLELGQQLEADRTTVCDCVNLIKKAINSHFWITEGRGPYEWNDDRYRQEFGDAVRAINKAIAPLDRIAADWSGCPRTREEVIAARLDLKTALAQANERLKSETARADFEEGRIVSICEKIGAEDLELATEKIDRLYAERREANERLAGLGRAIVPLARYVESIEEEPNWLPDGCPAHGNPAATPWGTSARLTVGDLRAIASLALDAGSAGAKGRERE